MWTVICMRVICWTCIYVHEREKRGQKRMYIHMHICTKNWLGLKEEETTVKMLFQERKKLQKP